MLQLYSVYTDGVVHGFGKMWPYSHIKHGQGEKKSFIYEI